MLQGAAYTGIYLDPYVAYNQTPAPSAQQVIDAVGQDFGGLTSSLLNDLTWVGSNIYSTQGASSKSRELIDQNRIVQARLFSHLRDKPRLLHVDRFGNFINSAILMVSSAAVLVAAAPGAPAVAAAGGIALALYSIGVALALVGAAIGLYGVSTALWYEGGDGTRIKDPNMCGTEWKPVCDISA